MTNDNEIRLNLLKQQGFDIRNLMDVKQAEIQKLQQQYTSVIQNINKLMQGTKQEKKVEKPKKK